jgi:precorrin-6B methylase 2
MRQTFLWFVFTKQTLRFNAQTHMKSLLLKFFPELYYALSSWCFFRRCKAKFQDQQNSFYSQVYKNGQISVLTGPFLGMTYYNKIIWGPITPKWIGSYEDELHGVIESVIARKYDTIVDVGAAEGYYAVGLALKCRDSKVISYDIDPIARHRQKQLAGLNSITNLEVRKYCTHKELNSLIRGKCFILSDIEGFEVELLDAIKCPGLKNCDLLVEIHSHGMKEIPEVLEMMIDRFSETHLITQFEVSARDANHYRVSVPKLQDIPEKTIIDALNEHRNPAQRWLWMESNTSQHN